MKWIGKLFSFFQIAVSYKKTRKQIDQILLPVLTIHDPDGSLTARDIRRMRDYPLQFIVFVFEIIAELRGFPLSAIEYERLVYFSAMACLFDDFFDEEELPLSDLKKLYNDPGSFVPQNTKQHICKVINEKLYKIFTNRQDYIKAFDVFVQSQIHSKLQAGNKKLSQKDLMAISIDKGGNAQVLSRMLLDHPFPPSEKATIYQLGGWYQIMDDIVDMDKDRKSGIQTLATRSKDMKELEQILQEQTLKLFDMLSRLDYPKPRIEKAIQKFHLISATGWRHLNRLKKLQSKTNGRFLIDQYTDRDLKWDEYRISNYFFALKFCFGKVH